MNKKATLITLGAIGGLSVVGTGVATFVYFYLGRTKTKESLLFSDNHLGVKLEVYNKNNDEVTTNRYQEIIKEFKRRVNQDLRIGPEYNSLNKIIFSGYDFIDEGVNGYYVPSIRTLVLNTSNVEKLIDLSDTKSFVEMIFQTLFHEYGHHIANEYFNTGGKDSWPKNWQNTFKSTLSYNDDQKLFPDRLLKDENGQPMKINGLKQFNVKSIGSKYSAKKLYDIANDGNDKTVPTLLDGDTIYIKGADDSIASYQSEVELDYYKVDLPKYLDYYYKMEELFTRKYMQILYNYDETIWNQSKYKKDINFSTGSKNIGWGNISPKGLIYSQTSIGHDRQSYESNIVQNPTEWITFMGDYIYSYDEATSSIDYSRASALYNSYKSILGYDSINNISYINSYIHSNITYDDGSVTATSNSNEISKKNKISIGGYTDVDYKYLVFEDKFIPISTKSFINGYKPSIESTDLIGNSNIRSWVTKEYLDYNDLLNKNIYFSQEKNLDNLVRLTPTTNVERKVSTKRYYYIGHTFKPDNYIETKLNNGFVQLGVEHV